MNKAFGVILLLMSIYLTGLLIAMVNYDANESKELAYLKLKYASNQASDAAVEEMIVTDSLGTDYTKASKMTVNPTMGLDAFLTVIADAYKLPLDDESKNYIKNKYISAVAVAGYDGCYTAIPRVIKSDTASPATPKNYDTDLTFGLKMPYSYKVTDNLGKVTTYALNMSMKGYYAMQGSSFVKDEVNRPKNANNVQLSDDEYITVINRNVSQYFSDAVIESNKANEKWNNYIYLPDQISMWTGSSPVNGPTFMALIQEMDINSNVKVNAFSIGGSKIEKNREVVVYIRNGTKYYCFGDIAPSVTVITTYSDEYEAARNGYYPDLDYMIR